MVINFKYFGFTTTFSFDGCFRFLAFFLFEKQAISAFTEVSCLVGELIITLSGNGSIKVALLVVGVLIVLVSIYGLFKNLKIFGFIITLLAIFFAGCLFDIFYNGNTTHIPHTYGIIFHYYFEILDLFKFS